MHDLNTINRINYEAFAADIIKQRAAGKHVVARYEGSRLVEFSTFDTRAEAERVIAEKDTPESRNAGTKHQLFAATVAATPAPAPTYNDATELALGKAYRTIAIDRPWLSREDFEVAYRAGLAATPAAPPPELCEQVCAAIKAADDKSVDEAGYMLDSNDCIAIVREEFARATVAATPKPAQGATYDDATELALGKAYRTIAIDRPWLARDDFEVAYRAGLAATPAPVEPVAWGMRDKTTGLILDVICPDEHESFEGDYTVPLFAATNN